MKDNLPIVSLDRTTVQEILPMLSHRGLFTEYRTLPLKADILHEEKLSLGVSDLTPSQEREVLSKVGQYRTSNYVIRDYGDYAIAFNAKLYFSYLCETEESLQDELLKNNYSAGRIEEALRRLKLYKLAHRMMIFILAEGFRQGKATDIEISKLSILNNLGYNSSEKHIYKDISDALFTLMFINYQIFEYQNKIKLSENSKTIGIFITNIKETKKNYTIDINPKFLGCVLHLIGETKNNSELFSRGYFSYPTVLLALTKSYSPAAYYLTNFLVSEKGNVKLNLKAEKIIAFKVSRLMESMNIRHSRISRRKREFMSALKEVEIIDKISPDFDTLTQQKPRDLEKTVLHISVKKEIKELDDHIKSNLLGAK